MSAPEATHSERYAHAFVSAVWLAVTALAIIVVARKLWALFASSNPWEVVGFVYDDAYYYLTAAANTVDFGRTTLDGFTLTNGFQPLWFAFVSVLGFTIGTEPMRFFRAFVVLICTIFLFSVLAGAPVNRSKRAIRRAALCTGIALVGLLWAELFLSGMETILVLPLIVGLVSLIERRIDRRTALLLSVVFTLAGLIRLDALALIPAYFAVVFFTESSRLTGKDRDPARQQANLRLLPWTLIVVVPVLITYAGINFAIYDTPVPVSGLAKSIGPRFENFGIVNDYLAEVRSVMPLAFAWLVAEAIAYMQGIRTKQLLRTIAVCVVAFAIQYFYYAAASTWNPWDWYFYLVGVLAVLFAARILLICHELITGGRWIPAVLSCLITFALIARPAVADVRYAFRPPPPPAPSSLQVADGDLRQLGRTFTYNEVSLLMLRDFATGESFHELPVAMGDRAGGLSYWGRTRLNVVHTEGLLLDYSYIEALRSGNATAYLSEYPNLEYYIVDRDWVPTIRGIHGQVVFVVADPIQTLRTSATSEVALFCFPASSVAYHVSYWRSTGPTERMAFRFAERIPCSSSAEEIIQREVRRGTFRQFSLPNEY